MFDHINFDISNLLVSAAFYESALAPLGHSKIAEYLDYGVVGFGTKRPQFWVVKGEPHAHAEEVHVCFSATSRKRVNDFYEAAIAAGGKDNGKPGLQINHDTPFCLGGADTVDNLSPKCSAHNAWLAIEELSGKHMAGYAQHSVMQLQSVYTRNAPWLGTSAGPWTK